MGEIGISRRDYLFNMSYWELVMIGKGYEFRYRNQWSSVRWQTFNFMSAMVDMRKAGIQSPEDLLPLPWDKKGRLPTPTEVDEMSKELEAANAAAGLSILNANSGD